MLRVVVYVAFLSCLHCIARADLSACLQKYKASEFTANVPVYPRAALRRGLSAGGTLHTEVGCLWTTTSPDKLTGVQNAAQIALSPVCN